MFRLIVFASLVFCVASAAAGEPDFSAYKGRIKGPPVMYGITTKCDSARLDAIKRKLKPGQQRVLFYRYTIFLIFENHRARLELSGMHFSKAVRQCILDGFASVSRPRGQLPASGRVPVKIAFPAIVSVHPRNK